VVLTELQRRALETLAEIGQKGCRIGTHMVADHMSIGNIAAGQAIQAVSKYGVVKGEYDYSDRTTWRVLMDADEIARLLAVDEQLRAMRPG
jgi:hypothetical protein